MQVMCLIHTNHLGLTNLSLLDEECKWFVITFIVMLVHLP